MRDIDPEDLQDADYDESDLWYIYIYYLKGYVKSQHTTERCIFWKHSLGDHEGGDDFSSINPARWRGIHRWESLKCVG